ncbi:YCII-related domain-containing protein [Tumebacillus sp. BK434]|uniref:YciI family protein n=1 Tax=Tumebacillus sp. BK434 TaxID=2512169 RepID=UPI001042FA73|nr:YciI family protein [Tumebacillus sp. BK434]TCP54447.1 YCII-related domain-containing protein [Tumebacillus sp. BK434]
MLVEPARHKSMSLTSVMTLEKIRAGVLSFQDALKDDGEFAMVGKGTAADGRNSELREELAMRNEYKGDPGKESKVARKQIAMLLGASPDHPDAELARILREYGGI